MIEWIESLIYHLLQTIVYATSPASYQQPNYSTYIGRCIKEDLRREERKRGTYFALNNSSWNFTEVKMIANKAIP